MQNPKNLFKARLKAGEQQIGIWNAVRDSAVTELLATCGYDWIVIDTEHGPIEVRDALPMLQAVGCHPAASAVVRPAINDWVLIKRHLDQGAQTLLLPYVQSRDEAEAAVRAMRYPPRGVRGVAGVTRASRYGGIEGYFTKAEEDLCLLLQVETATALDRLEEIATVEGVDGIFIGPADLAASMGHPGNSAHPDVVAAIEAAIGRLKAVGVPAGILATDPDFARRCMGWGTTFTAVAVDTLMLARGARMLRQSFGPPAG